MHKPLLARASILSRDLGQLGRREGGRPSFPLAIMAATQKLQEGEKEKLRVDDLLHDEVVRTEEAPAKCMLVTAPCEGKNGCRKS